MTVPKDLTRQRLETILRRQDPPRFGKDYEPAIKATVAEAPTRSRPAEVESAKLGRAVSTLKVAHREFLPLVLHCPWVIDLQEMRMLPYMPAPHPLHGHPAAEEMLLTSMKGTLAVAEELGVLRDHPVLEDESGREELEPGCWVGEFLVFLQDEAGPFCHNFQLEAREDGLAGPETKPAGTRKRRGDGSASRVEQRLYAHVDIPTFRVNTAEVDPLVVANLGQLLLWHKREHRFDDEQQEILQQAFEMGIDAGASALEVIEGLELSEGFDRYETKVWLHQAIWQRKLRIDLFQRFYMEEPLAPETQDIFDVYGNWFRRAAS